MKRWSGSLFPILLLSALAALTLWLEQASQVRLVEDTGKSRHDPDSIIERFHLRRLSPQGELQYDLVSPKAIHYADDETTHITTPSLTYFKPGSPDFNISSQRAMVTKGGEMVQFEEKVIATRAAQRQRPAMVATMSDLTVLPNDGKAFTHSRVDVSEGPSWLRGTGMELDNRTQIYKLLSRVNGTLYPRNGPKP